MRFQIVCRQAEAFCGETATRYTGRDGEVWEVVRTADQWGDPRWVTRTVGKSPGGPVHLSHRDAVRYMVRVASPLFRTGRRIRFRAGKSDATSRAATILMRAGDHLQRSSEDLRAFGAPSECWGPIVKAHHERLDGELRKLVPWKNADFDVAEYWLRRIQDRTTGRWVHFSGITAALQ